MYILPISDIYKVAGDTYIGRPIFSGGALRAPWGHNCEINDYADYALDLIIIIDRCIDIRLMIKARVVNTPANKKLKSADTNVSSVWKHPKYNYNPAT